MGDPVARGGPEILFIEGPTYLIPEINIKAEAILKEYGFRGGDRFIANIQLVPGPGFEPGFWEPKSHVLPVRRPRNSKISYRTFPECKEEGLNDVVDRSSDVCKWGSRSLTHPPKKEREDDRGKTSR